ncbi:MAG: TIGR01212 family radical SAM protein [Sulfurimonas sp. RIFCSPHIGHO2_12_FULL_36_9]|uniref:TIGR01212 family radical SAM protein n=1 Tax=Sulfurimonas sp. RIFCSPLOWO2_12_36_12 TaxID=1802253 RepID=UPI0008CC63A2|nr:TIGR01212 family radical SAM protein [Sulfurimonas sp. RIFCSPLOWO2_12_36_12]OHD96920.1 MAG: TIGR01212 family radical SAM protein [Sulfurimonas sp. RIFCSPLOWO2_02_FULL_36_28]OHD99180.1 MAG: TIGR01212 family radical SAM protein [Sulfurimonas sp. RIFCSPHIGHO2_12_FULL_36_9]OHE02156.1 MAG: TIGR01212 family radical SAM protein [Sulfurimonas sp. RIFCSPLOWO2_12_36_12]OHE08619.1 MAG: TIGR01212 family radical SAM protein [Sulfurimonas sp. RIFCSPLOWO2_12_FULL_36_74]
MEQIYTFGSYLKNKFGCKVYKVGINISGFTCPNIDGTVAKGGCTFCENDSFSASTGQTQELKGFHLNLKSKTNPNLDKQLQQLEFQFNAISKRQRQEYGAKKFLVYFQSFTNTYAPFETLKALYEKALSFPDVVGLSIGTRSDSITQETLEYLAELNLTKEIWIEFGIQSVYDETLEKINRGHSSANVKEWILKAKAKGLNVCGHLIFGLPDESQEMMLETSKQAYEWGIDSVKYHPLYVVKKTALANDFTKGTFAPITEDIYLDVLIKSIIMKPQSVSVQRVTAGINDGSLLAPDWCRDKNSQIKKINMALKPFGLKY